MPAAYELNLLRDYMETRKFEVSVKRKDAIDFFALHQNKRNTNGKTDMLIRLFAEKLQALIAFSQLATARR